jgi:histidyl-tRNA synthetase
MLTMERIKPRTLSGFMELLPKRQVQMERMMEVLRHSYALYGFTPLDTPAIEASEVLLAKGGGETEKQIYRFTKGDADLSLRFDLTVPLAKYVAMNYGQLTFPFRRYQIGKVYRGERAQRGRFREFYQADIDIIGDGQLDIINEAEIPSIIYRTFTSLGLQRFRIRVNNRKLLTGFYALLGLTEQSGAIMRTVDKLDKIGPEKVRQFLIEDDGVSPADADEIMAFIAITGTNSQVLSALERYRGRNEIFDTGLDELNTVVHYLSAFGVPEDHFAVDLTIARGLDYYTGTVYETVMLDHPEVGSICSGGRYDNLAAYYTDKTLPGVGISIGLTRLFFVLEDQGYLNDALLTAPADVLILPMTEDLAPAISLATRLREAGIRAQLYGEKKKFKAKMAYADRLGVPYVAFLGEDEIKAGQLSIKDMRTGQQVTEPMDTALVRIQEGLVSGSSGYVILDHGCGEAVSC